MYKTTQLTGLSWDCISGWLDAPDKIYVGVGGLCKWCSLTEIDIILPTTFKQRRQLKTKGQVTGDTGAESGPNYAGPKTPHPVAPPGWHTCQAWGASAKAGGTHWELQWEASCSLAQPGPRQALGKRQEPD